MNEVDNFNRELKVAMTKYIGQKNTPEIREEMKEKISELLYQNRLHKAYVAEVGLNGAVQIKPKGSIFWNVVTLVLALGCLLLFSIVNIKFGIAVLGFLLLGKSLAWLAKRDLEKIEAEKYGLTVEEMRSLEKKL